MLYDGKHPGEMTPEELQAAEDHVIHHMQLANAQYELNRVGYLEITEERMRRAKRLN